MSANYAAVANQGEVRSRRPADPPMQTGGHQPGKLVDNDAIPEFSTQTLPAGMAPALSTFTPNPVLNNQKM
ncbi:uncharacterized protein CC84DRAFT_1127384, partial [Paraphaeosphaeria sporulosa]